MSSEIRAELFPGVKSYKTSKICCIKATGNVIFFSLKSPRGMTAEQKNGRMNYCGRHSPSERTEIILSQSNRSEGPCPCQEIRFHRLQWLFPPINALDWTDLLQVISAEQKNPIIFGRRGRRSLRPVVQAHGKRTIASLSLPYFAFLNIGPTLQLFLLYV